MIKTDSPKYCDDFKKVAGAVFKEQGLSGNAYVEILFVSPAEIEKLNFKERGIDAVTDVLSFPALNKILPFVKSNYPFDYDFDKRAVILGSIVICGERAKAQAEEYGHSERRENCYLFLHGLLHLLGFDHIDDGDRQKMRAAEEKVLNSLNITRDL